MDTESHLEARPRALAGGNTGRREHPKHSRRRHPLSTQQSSGEQPTLPQKRWKPRTMGWRAQPAAAEVRVRGNIFPKCR